MEAAENDYRIVRRKTWRDSRDGTYRAARFAQRDPSGDGSICLAEADEHVGIRPAKTAGYVEICKAEVARGDGEIHSTAATEHGRVGPTGAVEHSKIRLAGSVDHDRIRPAESVQRELSCMARSARYA